MPKQTLTRNTYGIFTIDGQLPGNKMIHLSVVGQFKDVELVVKLLNNHTDINNVIHWECDRILKGGN